MKSDSRSTIRVVCSRAFCGVMVCLAGVSITSEASAETLKIVCPTGSGKVFIDGVELATCPGELDIQPGSFTVKVVFEDGTFESEVNLKPGKDSILIAKPSPAATKPPEPGEDPKIDEPKVETPENDPKTDTTTPEVEDKTPPRKTSTARQNTPPEGRKSPYTYKLEPSQISVPYRSTQEARWSAAGEISGFKFGYAPRIGFATLSNIDENMIFVVSPLAGTVQYLADLSSTSPSMARVKLFAEGSAEMRIHIIEGAPLMLTPLLVRGGVGYHLGRGVIPGVFMGLGLSPLGIGAPTPIFPATHLEIGSGLNAIGNPLGFEFRTFISWDRFRAPIIAPETPPTRSLVGFGLTAEMQF